MKTRVVYHSTTGNTKKLAEAMADALGTRAEPAEDVDAVGKVDVLFLGGAVYATFDHDYHPELRRFIQNLDPKSVGKVAIFGTYAFSDSIEKLKTLVKQQGLPLADEHFFCKGKFLFFNARRPNSRDLEGAAGFARKLAGA